MNELRVTKEWCSRGFSCDRWIDPPGQRWENFSHRVDELLMLVEGKLELEIQGKTLQPRIGEEVFIPANAIHSVRNIGNTQARWLYGYSRRPQ